MGSTDNTTSARRLATRARKALVTGLLGLSMLVAPGSVFGAEVLHSIIQQRVEGIYSVAVVCTDGRSGNALVAGDYNNAASEASSFCEG